MHTDHEHYRNATVHLYAKPGNGPGLYQISTFESVRFRTQEQSAVGSSWRRRRDEGIAQSLLPLQVFLPVQARGVSFTVKSNANQSTENFVRCIKLGGCHEDEQDEIVRCCIRASSCLPSKVLSITPLHQTAASRPRSPFHASCGRLPR